MFLQLDFEQDEPLTTGEIKMLIEILKQSGTVEFGNNIDGDIRIEFYKKEKEGEK